MARANSGSPAPTELYTTPDQIAHLLWWPDGSRLTFTVSSDTSPSQTTIFTLGAAGGAPSLFAPEANVAGLAWSPDGAQLAVTSRSALKLLNRNGAGRVLFSNPLQDGWLAQPVWSPEGGRIMLLQARSVAPGPGFPSQELWVVGLNGAGTSLGLTELVPSSAAWHP